VTVQRLEEKLQDGSFAPACGAAAAQTTRSARSHGFRRHGFFVDIAPAWSWKNRSSCRTSRMAGRRMCACRCASATAPSDHVERRPELRGIGQLGQHLLLGDDSEVVWVIVQDQPEPPRISAQFNASSARTPADAIRHECRRQTVRQEIASRQRARAAPSRCAASTCLRRYALRRHHAARPHGAPHQFAEVIRNIVTGRRMASSRVASTCTSTRKKTDAKMALHTLLLSDDGEFSTKPELEIFAMTGSAGHGGDGDRDTTATICFYLMAARHRREDGARIAGQGVPGRGHRGNGRTNRSSRRSKGCSTNGSRRMGEA